MPPELQVPAHRSLFRIARVTGLSALARGPGFLAPGVVCACVSGIYSGALVAAWKLEASVVSNAFRGTGALAGALVGVALRELWPVAAGLTLGEACRLAYLGRVWRRAGASTG